MGFGPGLWKALEGGGTGMGFCSAFGFGFGLGCTPNLWRKDLRCPVPVGASLGPVDRSGILLRITWALISHPVLQILQLLCGRP